MTKKEIIAWAIDKRNKALQAVSLQHRDAKTLFVKELMDDIFLDDYAKAVQKKCELVDSQLDEFIAQLPEGVVYIYLTLSQVIRSYIGNPDATKSKMFNSLSYVDSPKYKAIGKKFDNIRDEVDHNYNRVIINLKSLKNAKACLDYLEGLGFDLNESTASINQTECTDVACVVDTQYLFVTYDKQEDE